MFKRFATSTAVIAALALPIGAFAQGATSYYIVQDVKTKKCTIVDKKPTSTTEFTILGNTFKTRTEAESGMKTEKVCVSN